jgi:hypothetical protein
MPVAPCRAAERRSDTRAESSSPATLSKSREAHHGRTGHLSALDPANLRVGHADGVSQRFLAQAVLESGQA